MNYCNKIFTTSYTLRVKIDLRKKSRLKMNNAKKYFFCGCIDGQGASIHFLIIKIADHDNF